MANICWYSLRRLGMWPCCLCSPEWHVHQAAQPSQSVLCTPAGYTAGFMVQLMTLPLHMMCTETSQHICALHCGSCITHSNMWKLYHTFQHVEAVDHMSCIQCPKQQKHIKQLPCLKSHVHKMKLNHYIRDAQNKPVWRQLSCVART